jgi:hypothetical protein
LLSTREGIHGSDDRTPGDPVVLGDGPFGPRALGGRTGFAEAPAGQHWNMRSLTSISTPTHLRPLLREMEENIVLHLLREFEDRRDLYVEFNLAEKLRGAFEEQAVQLQTSVGGPYAKQRWNKYQDTRRKRDGK